MCAKRRDVLVTFLLWSAELGDRRLPTRFLGLGYKLASGNDTATARLANT